MSDNHDIPAASIGETDLAVVALRFPEAAREIARLEDLMHRGEETKAEFHRLCELLHEVGGTKDAEYLLRRNLEYYEGQELYRRLFGTAIPDNFARAVARFGEEFGLALTMHKERGFLDQEYRSDPLDHETARFNILDDPCVIRFSYSHRDFVVADVADAAANEAEAVNYYDLNTNVFFRWQAGRWLLMDPRDA
jgi:hypothetical protein